MNKQRNPTHASGTKTSEIPAYEASQLHEPPMPDSLPEFPEAHSTTGKFHPISEGEDKARLRDDSSTSSEPVNRK